MLKKPARPITIVQTLVAARRLLTPAKRWGKGDYRRGRGDKTRFCAIGALGFVDGPFERKAYELLRTVCIREHKMGVVDYNDEESTTHKMILRLFDRVIAVAKKA